MRVFKRTAAFPLSCQRQRSIAEKLLVFRKIPGNLPPMEKLRSNTLTPVAFALSQFLESQIGETGKKLINMPSILPVVNKPDEVRALSKEEPHQRILEDVQQQLKSLQRTILSLQGSRLRITLALEAMKNL